MRKRFKMSRIASSDNYELSRKIHAMYLQRFHEENIEVITEISRGEHRSDYRDFIYISN